MAAKTKFASLGSMCKPQSWTSSAFGASISLDIFLSFQNEVTPLTLTTNLRIILRSKPEIFRNIEARKQLGVLTKIKVCMLYR